MGTGLAECVEASNVGSYRDLRGALEAAPSLLKSDERVLQAEAVGTTFPDDFTMGGILMLLTDSRVLLIWATGWRNNKVESAEIPLRSITSVGVTKRGKSMLTDVHSRSGLYRISPWDTAAQELATTLQELVDRPAAAAPATSADPLEKLKKLGELRDQGILTEEEFQQKKLALLDEV